MKRLAIVAMLVLACGTPAASPSPSGHGLNGTMTLYSDSIAVSSGTCHGTGGYSDIKAGAAVTIRNQAEEIVATGYLSANVVTAGTPKGQCGFTFGVAVPPATFYTIEVSHRGEVTYSLDDLEASGWAPSLTLGTP